MFIHIIMSIYTYLRALSYIHTVYKVTFIVSNNNWWEIILLDQSTYVVLLEFIVRMHSIHILDLEGPGWEPDSGVTDLKQSPRRILLFPDESQSSAGTHCSARARI